LSRPAVPVKLRQFGDSIRNSVPIYWSLPTDWRRITYAVPEMLTVISWYAARRAHRDLEQVVLDALTEKPTLFAVVADVYTNEVNLRPFVPLAERFGEGLHVLLAAEWPQAGRERDGEILLRRLGLAAEARSRLLRDDGPTRAALVLRDRKPAGIVDLFFRERRRVDDEIDAGLRAREAEAARAIETLLAHLPPPAPPHSQRLAPGEHDWSPAGICRLCGEGRGALLACAGTRSATDTRHDRFELIEID
jgi:hypothetical protein